MATDQDVVLDTQGGDTLLPYKRDAKGARPWIKAGTPGLMHRIGGLEKEDVTGNISSPRSATTVI